MEDLKSKWAAADTAVKLGIAAGAAIIAIIFVLKVLPYLVAAMGLGALLVILFIPYWIPTILAFTRHHPSKAGIFVLNFFFGWTFIGWVVSLAWALSNNASRAPQSIVVHTTVSPSFNVNAGLPATHVAPYQGGNAPDSPRLDGISAPKAPVGPLPPSQ